MKAMNSAARGLQLATATLIVIILGGSDEDRMLTFQIDTNTESSKLE